MAGHLSWDGWAAQLGWLGSSIAMPGQLSWDGCAPQLGWLGSSDWMAGQLNWDGPYRAMLMQSYT